MHEQENHQLNKKPKNKPINAIEFEILTGTFGEITNNNDTHRECKRCNRTNALPLNLIRRVNAKQPTTTTGSAICPFSPMIFPNVDNLQVHSRKHRCPNMQQNVTPGIWEELVQKTSPN